MERILVLRGGALGDFIVTLPALARLRERWPRSRVEFAGNATAAELARARGLVDAVHSQHQARWAELFSEAPLSTPFAEWLAQFDLVLSFWPDPDGTLASHFPRHEHQRFLSDSAHPKRAPAAAHYTAVLGNLGIEPGECYFPLRPLAESALGDTHRPRDGVIAIHPGSGSPRKNWPVEKWQQLVRLVPNPVSLILGDAETTHVEQGFLARWPVAKDRPAILRNRPLEELVRHFAQCRLFLGHDSGISHLAAACGAKCVLLFGPTEAASWAPPAPNVRVLHQGLDLNSLPVDVVWRAAQEALGDRT